MLEARNVTFSYSRGEEALYRSFDLRVESDERVALQAPSGFGKTTLCRILAGYELPQQGSVLADGVPVAGKGRCPVQMVGQHPELAVDPRMRMRATLEEAGELGSELAAALGIRSEWLSRYPHELSGGELQRFCIARALIARPRYLIADEVSTMLDAVTQVQIWHVILEYVERNGAGLVFVSHSPALTQRIATRAVDLAATR